MRVHIQLASSHPTEYLHEYLHTPSDREEEPDDELVDRSRRERDRIVEPDTEDLGRDLTEEQYDHERADIDEE